MLLQKHDGSFVDNHEVHYQVIRTWCDQCRLHLNDGVHYEFDQYNERQNCLKVIKCQELGEAFFRKTWSNQGPEAMENLDQFMYKIHLISFRKKKL